MENFEVGQATAHYNANGTRVLRYSVEVKHNGLNEYKILSAPDLSMLQHKVNSQVDKWEEKWEKLTEKKEKAQKLSASIEEAQNRTTEAQQALIVIDNLLKHTLDIDDAIDWEAIKNKAKYSIEKPKKPTQKDNIEFKEKEPQLENYQLKLNLFDKIFKGRRIKKIELSEQNFKKAHNHWLDLKQKNSEENNRLVNEYNQELAEWNNETKNWEKDKNQFLKEQDEYNEKIELLKSKHQNQEKEAIEEYCDMVLNNSKYPDSFPQNFELEYLEKSKILIVEYSLPSKDTFPRIKDVKFIKARNELKESYISESMLNKIFDDAMYKITLRTIHELFEADRIDAIEAINFNGWVKSINKGTGKLENTCILSILAKKEEFLEINLEYVDPKACFKNLKGVGSSKLFGITPIKPIMQLDRSDRRFVDSYDVVTGIDSTTNLAAMNWEDFEHLIRELFEKEFSVNGGEVKVTQASRDGGVDAIAFDPDPIRGGKIVIQAKRYTNTVGVSAVRDLYGTLVNEGATKGILVSTADYGPDAYNFAKDKPITLLNGGNLLHLLQKHGHQAKIDLKEAKLILAEEQNE